MISWLITKAGPLRYFFGLSTPADSMLPGKKMDGFVPLNVMGALFLAGIFIAHFV